MLSISSKVLTEMVMSLSAVNAIMTVLMIDISSLNYNALQMLEARFTVEHLANILKIPTSKTLLRRHLSGHFVNLVGQSVQMQKREVEQKPGMSLTLNMKVKSKKPLFKRGVHY